MKNPEKEEKSGRFFHFAPPDRQGWLRYWTEPMKFISQQTILRTYKLDKLLCKA